MPNAIVADRAGGPGVLKFRSVERPAPGPGELLVEVSGIGVNFIDTYQRSGVYPVPFPFTPGGEAAGRVVDVGPDVTGFSAGDRVATAEGARTYAEYALIPAAKALRVPDGVDDETAAAIPLQGMTAHYLATSVYPAKEGEWALVHAGAGGTGLLLTQLLKSRGARVITTVSTDEKAELSRGAGADEVIGYDGFTERVRAITGGGADVVYDGVGKSTFDGSLASLRVRGFLALFGGASGQVPPFDLQRLNSSGSIVITRPSLAAFLLTPEERAMRASDLFDAVLADRLKVHIGGVYPLADAAAAHADLESRSTTGKLVLRP
ncbi:quinone oxidoreductase family protein [Planctomonas psychrotolerans]|uniref:quinone oxidoreductase family protein n=1 Tax=Planctomonas psychrotolerans TaxID=2528712 RepID=UPI00123B7D3C|nr:quinone oxidoreductase [Planctomonas psychrotolerans]